VKLGKGDGQFWLRAVALGRIGGGDRFGARGVRSRERRDAVGW
jgi:hypothetical protein